MALVIEIPRGGSFWCNETECKLEHITSPTRCSVLVIGEAINSKFQITDQQTVEIMPNVRVSVALKSGQDKTRLSIDAPRSIRINRRDPALA